MKGLLSVLRYYLLPVSVIRIIMLLGLVVAIGSLFVPAELHHLGLTLGLAMTLFPATMASGFTFRQLVSNPRVTLAPHGRLLALAGLACIAILDGLVAAWLLPHPWQGALVFASVTAWLLITQWIAQLPFRFAPLLAWLAFIGATHLLPKHLHLAAAPLELPALLLAVLAWLVMAWRLPRQQKMRGPFQFARANTTLVSKLQGDEPVKTPADTMLLGFRSSLGASLTSYGLVFFGFPVLFMLVMSLLRGDLSFLNEAQQHPQVVYVMLGYGLLMAPLRTFDLVARLRLLWLRHGGDRQQLWQLLDRVLRREALLASALVAVVLVITGLLSHDSGQTTALLLAQCAAYLWSAQYLVGWLRQLAWHPVTRTLLGVVLLIPAIAMAIYGYLHLSWAVAALAYLLVLGSVSRWALGSTMGSQNWIRLHPVNPKQWQRGKAA
ncbi:hypothetical protein [Gallaecimonas sp. GXIMD1310]|uniref:hypothetical protein n=1 Tax=Gallaecimonas sp. GXIMD1310 TaxID=3131926 RepID=UPI0032470684